MNIRHYNINCWAENKEKLPLVKDLTRGQTGRCVISYSGKCGNKASGRATRRTEDPERL